MPSLSEAQEKAARILELLAPHCERIEIAGSVRREKPHVKDIEIVAIPKPYEVGLFASGLALVVERWPKRKGELGPSCRYTQRIFEGTTVDLFFCRPETWGLILAIRTGPTEFSKALLERCKQRGYHSVFGQLHRRRKYQFGSVDLLEQLVPVDTPEEEAIFEYAGLKYIPPTWREEFVDEISTHTK